LGFDRAALLIYGFQDAVTDVRDLRSPGGSGAARTTLEEKRETMRNLKQQVVNFLVQEDGPTAVEYAVMLALIIVVCIGAITTLGKNANGTFTSVGTAISSS
jgi:pilus assembly protein Flp/PilA